MHQSCQRSNDYEYAVFAGLFCARVLVILGLLTATMLTAWSFLDEAAYAGDPAICGDASGDGEVKASDAMFTLQSAVGTHDCPLLRCDCNASGSVTASDAMDILKTSVGIPVDLRCPQPEPLPTTTSTTTTTTSTTTTTTAPSTCGNQQLDDGEDCDPPGWYCRGGCNLYTGICVDFVCSDSCTCPPPVCGDGMIDPNEDCDPPGSPCESGTCGSACGCEP
jgi:hypothetical protein